MTGHYHCCEDCDQLFPCDGRLDEHEGVPRCDRAEDMRFCVGCRETELTGDAATDAVTRAFEQLRERGR